MIDIMKTLTYCFVLIVFVKLSCSLELNIQNKENIIVKLVSNDQDNLLEDYCLAKFGTKNSEDKIKSVDHKINNMKKVSLDMPWLAPDVYQSVCFYKSCEEGNPGQPMCQRFLVPR